MTISLLRYSSECNIIFIREKKFKQFLFEKLVYIQKKENMIKKRRKKRNIQRNDNKEGYLNNTNLHLNKIKKKHRSNYDQNKN